MIFTMCLPDMLCWITRQIRIEGPKRTRLENRVGSVMNITFSPDTHRRGRTWLGLCVTGSRRSGSGGVGDMRASAEYTVYNLA